MKYIAAALLLIIAVCPINGGTLTRRWTRAMSLDDDDKCAESKVFTCASCTETRICHPDANGKFIHYLDSQCPEERKYCDPSSGTCTNIEPSNCGSDEDDFVCMDKNAYFPAMECNQFHFCDEKYTPKKLMCNPSTLVFDPITSSCVDASTTQCGSYSCGNNPVKKANHEVFDTYFALCGEEKNANAPIVLDACPKFYSVNITSQLCEPNCEKYKDKNVPDYTDCHYYFHCSVNYLTEEIYYPETKRMFCPEKQAYDPTSYSCIDEADVISCTKS